MGLIPARSASEPVTPLKAHSFKTLLTQLSLSERYPTLVHYISHGFPIGPMPPVCETIIQRNHISSSNDITIAHSNFLEEVKLSRMIGPITITEAQIILGSNFRTSPVGLVPKANSPGKFRVIRDLSYCGSAAQSVNDLIPADRPTRWVAAPEFALQVCGFFYFVSAIGPWSMSGLVSRHWSDGRNLTSCVRHNRHRTLVDARHFLTLVRRAQLGVVHSAQPALNLG